jgi:hypothetical protein
MSRTFTIQPKQTSVMQPRPYPYQIDEAGDVLGQDFWKGDPAAILGFQPTQDDQRVTLFFSEFTENPMKAIGMFPVFITADGGMYNLNLSIESVQVLP